MNDLSFKQITLITDGYSNYGISPIESARLAYTSNIIVNVIGITNGSSSFGDKGVKEIEEIANSGGGLYQIVPLEQISKTVQMVTKKAINRTIQQVVHTELTQILGKGDIMSIPPSDRLEVVKMMDELAEYSNLKILLLIDNSTSMKSKTKKVKEAIIDFQLSLQARSGNSEVSIATFPGINDYINIEIPWTTETYMLDNMLNNLNPNGYTPTGPAILTSIKYFNENNKIFEKSGVLDEYII